jgi:hypothetical protein
LGFGAIDTGRALSETPNRWRQSNPIRGEIAMEVINYLAQEMKQQEQKRQAKHARMRKLVSDLTVAERPEPVELDFLGD